MIRYLLIFFLCIVSTLAKQQNDAIDLLRATKNYYETIVTDTSGCFLKYEQIVIFDDGTNPVNNVVEILFNNMKVHIKSNNYTMFGDTTLSILVYDEHNAIYFNNSSTKIHANERTKLFAMLFDSLLTSSEVLEFHIHDRIATLKLRFTSNMEQTATYDKSIITYAIDTSNYNIQSMKISYTKTNPDRNIESIEYKFHEQKIVIRDEFFDSPIEYCILDSNGNLKKRYENYQILSK
jgi:hypothetical protein